jgi:hypothetical protein
MITCVSSVIRPEGSDLIFDHPYNADSGTRREGQFSAGSGVTMSLFWAGPPAVVSRLPPAHSAGRRPYGRILKPALGQALRVAEWRTNDLSSSSGTAG